MKNIKKIFSTVLVIAMAAVMVTGCANTQVSGQEVTEAYYKLYALGDSTDVSKFAIVQSLPDAAKKYVKESIMTKINKKISAKSIEVADEDKDRIYDAIIENNKKLTYSVDKVSESGDKQTVKVKTTYFQTDKIIDEVMNENCTTSKDFTDKFIEKLNNAKPSDDSKECEVECGKSSFSVGGEMKDVYGPNQESVLTTNIYKMINGEEPAK